MIWSRPIDPNYPKGRLTGSVSCASTGLPLASATITAHPFGPVADVLTGYSAGGESGPDGSFDLSSLLAGTYYVFASLPGYASPASLLATFSCFGVPRHFTGSSDVLAQSLDTISITPQQVCNVDLFLHKAASISGRVTWQDGSPARANAVSLMLVDGENRRPYEYLAYTRNAHSFESVTDDDGRFHLTNLFTGRYIVGHHVPRFLPYVRKNLHSERGPETINCFSSFYWTGQKPYIMDALPIDIIGGTHLVGLDTQLPMLEQEPLQRLPIDELQLQRERLFATPQKQPPRP